MYICVQLVVCGWVYRGGGPPGDQLLLVTITVKSDQWATPALLSLRYITYLINNKCYLGTRLVVKCYHFYQ